MAPLGGCAIKRLKLQREKQTKKLGGSIIQFVKPNSFTDNDNVMVKITMIKAE